jgi:hypothetical protein
MKRPFQLYLLFISHLFPGISATAGGGLLFLKPDWKMDCHSADHDSVIMDAAGDDFRRIAHCHAHLNSPGNETYVFQNRRTQSNNQLIYITK